MKNFEILSLDYTVIEKHDNPIFLLEVTDAIKIEKNCKSSGPDGFGIEFYKIF